jgi:hypothetical protein
VVSAGRGALSAEPSVTVVPLDDGRASPTNAQFRADRHWHVRSAIAVSVARRMGRRHRPRAWDARCARFLSARTCIIGMTDTLCVESHVARTARMRVLES